MPKKQKATAVKKINENIEVTIGAAPVTKYDIMREVAKTHTIYGATVWLNSPLLDHENKTPAQLMREGEMELVAQLIREYDAGDSN